MMLKSDLEGVPTQPNTIGPSKRLVIVILQFAYSKLAVCLTVQLAQSPSQQEQQT